MLDFNDKDGSIKAEITFDNIADALANTGYIVLPHALSHSTLLDLQQRIQNIPPDRWLPAGIGRNQNYQLNTEIRNDKIAWMTTDNKAECAFQACMEKLRLAINQRLYLGLFDYESHFSIYPKGSYYKKHLDSLKGTSNRMLSTVLYLNSNWQSTDAGELLIYSQNAEKSFQAVLPHLGTLVIFMSEEVPHEVIVANRERHSIAGWFRLNPSQSRCVDPAN